MKTDKRIGELPSAAYIYDNTLLVAEQQGQAVKITAGQLRKDYHLAAGKLSQGRA